MPRALLTCACVPRVSDYVHFGPRPLLVKLLHQQTQVETFEACLHAHMAGKRKKPAHFDCLQTAGPFDAKRQSSMRHATPFQNSRTQGVYNPHGLLSLPARAPFSAGLQIRFFCGISNFCRGPSAEALQRAVANVEAHFAAVAVVEEMALSVAVLEAALPALFRGLAKRYQRSPPPPSPAAIFGGRASREGRDHTRSGPGGPPYELRARANGAAKASGGALRDPRAKAFVLAAPAMQLEYQLYNFTVARLHAQARACRLEQ